MLHPDIARCDGYVPLGSAHLLPICATCRRLEPGGAEWQNHVSPVVILNPVDGSRICEQRIAPRD